MAQVDSNASIWTAVDVVHRFGAIPLDRILRNPAPGTATVADVVRLDEHEDRLCELIDGTLVGKTMGYYESYLALRIGMLLSAFVNEANLGIVAGADGMLQILPEQVRIPDASFVSWDRLKGSRFPHDPAPLLAPDLAVEIISKSNTKQEMDRKLHEYFEAGAKMVWYVYPGDRKIEVYDSPTEVSTLSETDELTGGEVLPGLSIDLKTYFTLPQALENSEE